MGLHRASALKLVFLALKLLVTGACLWHVSRRIDFGQVFSGISLLDFRWTLFATVLSILQIPLLAGRWTAILAALEGRNKGTTCAAMIAATAISTFIAQVLPNAASEGVRALLLIRIGCDWRKAITSVVLDRVAGVGLLIAVGFGVLLLSSRVTWLAGYQKMTLAIFGIALATGVLALLLVPIISPMLARYRYSKWLAALATDAHRVLFGPKAPAILLAGCLVHAFTIAVIWTLGRALGLSFSAFESATLFTFMVGVSIMPISISGWGIREMTVIGMLASQGIGPETALLFSASFGLVFAVASLPGVLVWMSYSFVPPLQAGQQ